MASIELRCSVCPSKPKFSDQSHLLTHVGSKGHLSHYFKVQVRAQQDPGSRAQLREYDEWFAKNNIQDLLSQRLKARDNKSVPRRAPAAKGSQSKKKTSRKKRSDPEDQTEYDLQAGLLIDPNLESHTLLPAPSALTSSTAQPRAKRGTTTGRSAPVAQMRADEFENFGEPLAAQEEQGELLRTPRSKGVTDNLRSLDAPAGHFLTPIADSTQLDPSPLRLQLSPPISERALSVTTSSTAQSKFMKDYAPGDPATLKGVVWPGMDLFDTADIDSRRKRNQKKDESTLHKMEVDSLGFEPTEVIYYYPSWDLKKARYISGEVESSPPPEISLEDLAPSYEGTRKPLTELDPNFHRGKRPKTRKLHTTTAPKKMERAYNDLESDFELQAGNGRKRTRAFQVFRDSPTKSKAKHQQASDMPLLSDSLLPQDTETIHPTSQYMGQIHQPQPLPSENFSFLNYHNLFDGPAATPNVRDTSIFRLDQTRPEESHAVQSPPHGLPLILDSPQRYFTAGAGDVQIRRTMPPYVDMAIAYGLHHGFNPFHTNRLSSDVMGNFLGHGVSPQVYQDPPIELRQSPRYSLHRNSPVSDGSSSDATIDQGISERNPFVEA